MMSEEVIDEQAEPVYAADGTGYRVRICGRQQRPDGPWSAWLEFHPADAASAAPVLRTGPETTQPDRGALEYWAGRLTPAYVDGAFRLRALP